MVVSDVQRPDSRAERFFISLRSASWRLNEAILASNQTIRHHHWVSDIKLNLASSPSRPASASHDCSQTSTAWIASPIRPAPAMHDLPHRACKRLLICREVTLRHNTTPISGRRDGSGHMYSKLTCPLDISLNDRESRRAALSQQEECNN